MINHLWPFNLAGSSDAVGLFNATDTHVAWTGMRLGKGIFGLAIFSETGADARTGVATTKTSPFGTPSPAWLSDAESGVSYNTGTAYIREIRSPAGGIAQFKGLTQDTSNDKYVEVNCRKVHPYFGGTAWSDINNASAGASGTSGFLVTCMTGIS
jgi:hypothetical protein